MSMVPIVILASGRGSNFEAIADAIQSKKLDVEIRAVISDQPGAAVLTKARVRGIPGICIPMSKEPISLEKRRLAHEELILSQLKSLNPKFLVLAGYMRILTSRLIEAFRCDRGYSRMVNIHPSLLPAFPGVHAYSQAFNYGVKVTGVTIHLVELDLDSGPICAQEAFSIADCTSSAEVEGRGLKVEHRLVPEALQWILKEEFKFERREGRFNVCQS